MLLLDTCVLIWLSDDAGKLSSGARNAVGDETNQLYVSAISAWEVGIGVSKRRLQLQIDAPDWFRSIVTRYHLQVIEVSWMDAMGSTRLPDIHGDPADRMIIATSLSHELTVVTPDPEFARYPNVKVLW
jgi:PIN domain nuclease of toxin-antitoxin system